ncbi:MAG: hypothetical protein EXR07_15260 [Acetobacteraceae bacterium]|nr:hypothetical protein [Acetobacteraceae bacterium]
MAIPRFGGGRLRAGRRGLSLAEISLALSVILGFLFVSVRIMNMGMPESWTHVAGNGNPVVKADIAPSEPNTTAMQTR